MQAEKSKEKLGPAERGGMYARARSLQSCLRGEGAGLEHRNIRSDGSGLDFGGSPQGYMKFSKITEVCVFNGRVLSDINYTRIWS